MKNLTIYLLAFLFSTAVLSFGDGSSCEEALILYPSDDCDNSDGSQFAGKYSCEWRDCNLYDMPADGGGINGSCTPDNDADQLGVWIKFTATASDATFTNKTRYTGPGADPARNRDHLIFSGECGALTEISCRNNLLYDESYTLTGLTPGETYYMWVTRSDESLGTCGTCNGVATCITSTVPYSQPNGECSGALNMTTNEVYQETNGNAPPDGPGAVCLDPASGSVENNTWYYWCTPADWVEGETAYLSVFNNVCNSTQGNQVGVFGAGQECGSFTSSIICNNPGEFENFYWEWVPDPGDCYYINFDGYAGASCTYYITIGADVIIELPVELVSFSAEKHKNSNVISWITASEKNNDYFLIEKSLDGENWRPIGKVSGAGNSSEMISYSLKDENVDDVVNYYRLTQVDFDGKFETFNIF